VFPKTFQVPGTWLNASWVSRAVSEETPSSASFKRFGRRGWQSGDLQQLEHFRCLLNRFLLDLGFNDANPSQLGCEFVDCPYLGHRLGHANGFTLAAFICLYLALTDPVFPGPMATR
jgi:hypothetical protein